MNPAKTAEVNKVGLRKGYTEMYKKIGYEFQGFGIEIGGRVGARCLGLDPDSQRQGDVVGGERGKSALPDGANVLDVPLVHLLLATALDRGGTIQGFSAEMTVDRSRRLAELRVMA